MSPLPTPRLLVVCAVAQELAALRLSNDVDTLVCGVGPVEAALSLAAMLATCNYDLVLNVGISGGFAPHVDVGSQVVVSAEHYVELGREDGAALILPEHARFVQSIDLANELHRELRDTQAVFGPAITSATITTTNARAAALRLRFPGIVSESMEGFAIARAAAFAGVACLQLRGISNRVGDRHAAGWDLEAGFVAAAALTDAVIARLT